MKAFTVVENGVIPIIEYAREPFPHVPVGRSAPGSRYTMLGLGDTLVKEYPSGAFARAFPKRVSVGHTKIVEELPPLGRPEERALVKFAVGGGPGGVGRVTAARQILVECPLRGQTAMLDSWVYYPHGGPRCVFCLQPLVEGVHNRFNHRPLGMMAQYPPVPQHRWEHTARPDPDDPKVYVLAEGSAAGEDRHAQELVCVMEPGAALRVVRTGEVDPDRAEGVVDWDGKELALDWYGRGVTTAT